MSYDDLEETNNFRKSEVRKGFKGYWFILLLIIIGSSTLYAGVEFRKVLPPLPFLVQETPPAAAHRPVNSGDMELN
jgi:hypothetical protein